jgi:hypothetical protein
LSFFGHIVLTHVLSSKLLAWYYTSISTLIERLKEKDKQIAHLLGESRDVLTTLRDVARKDKVKDRKWSEHHSSFYVFHLRFPLGTVTRSQAWHSLDKDSRVKDSGELTEQLHVKKAGLESKFGKVSIAKWKEEKHMYPDIIKVMKSEFYTEDSGPKVVDTHDRGDFRADVSVSDYNDEKFAYCRGISSSSNFRRLV